jgi:hypothetical protein
LRELVRVLRVEVAFYRLSSFCCVKKNLNQHQIFMVGQNTNY